MIPGGPLRCLYVAAVAGVMGACHAPVNDSRAARFAVLPDWTGIWVSAEPVADVGISGYTEGDMRLQWRVMGFSAPYNDATRARLTALLRQGAPVLKYESWGFPFMMEAPTPLQFLVTPEETVIINYYRDIRHIHTDGRALPAEDDRLPTPWGESTGHWEGDTLVVETVSAERPGIGPPALLVSSTARYAERIRKTGPDRIEVEMTVTDPSTLKEPWVLKLGFKRTRILDRMFHSPFDNDRTVIDSETKNFTIAPPSGEPGG